MNLATKKEINKEYLEAVELYENEIRNESHASLDSYINLAFLYWSFAFEHFEFNIPNSISEKWSIVGGERYSNVLEMGMDIYPNSIELVFWKKYFSHIIFGHFFSIEDCEKLIKKHNNDKSIVPYFYLYSEDRNKYKSKIAKLIDECEKQPTAKNLYIKSLIGN